jgi:tRNA pseudouridine synthase 10
MDILDHVVAILEYGPICDHCLGRFFGKLSYGLSNDERGNALRISVALRDNVPAVSEPEECWVCNRLFDDISIWMDRVLEALEGIEYFSFLIGCRVSPLMAESEEMVWSDLALSSPEPLKAEFNRELGKMVSKRTEKEVNFQRPDIVVICDIIKDSVEIQINSIFIYGRYKKLVRGIPQTRWHCRVCRGKGCERCNFTGKMYPESVEELIGASLISAFFAEDAILHGAGREDIDARMLGSGRPFVCEVITPRKRHLALADLETAINSDAAGKVVVTLDHWSDRREVETIKSQKAHKKYSILVEVDGALSIEDVQNAVNALVGVTIHQRTPERVAHRRADRVRRRRVLEMECVAKDDDRFFIEVVGEAGLYIKELISGDHGRTKPSLTEILGASARVVTLDVVMVEGVVPELLSTEAMADNQKQGEW